MSKKSERIWGELLKLPKVKSAASDSLISDLFEALLNDLYADLDAWNAAQALQQLELKRDTLSLICGCIPLFYWDRAGFCKLVNTSRINGLKFKSVANELVQLQKVNLIDLQFLEPDLLWFKRLDLEFWATRNMDLCPKIQSLSLKWMPIQILLDAYGISEQDLRSKAIDGSLSFFWACSPTRGVYKADGELLSCMPLDRFLINSGDLAGYMLQDKTLAGLRGNKGQQTSDLIRLQAAYLMKKDPNIPSKARLVEKIVELQGKKVTEDIFDVKRNVEKKLTRLKPWGKAGRPTKEK